MKDMVIEYIFGCGLCNVFSLLVLGFFTVIYYWCKGNPFIGVQQPPISLNELEKKRLLRTTFQEKKIPENVDVIIIGSGASGLVCAGCLSRMGKKVLVLEQHDRAGGSTHTFEMEGFEFDVGVHYVGNMADGDMDHMLFDVLSDGQLGWDKLDSKFDSVVLNDKEHSMILFGNGEEKKYTKSLLKYFPKEEDAIKKFDTLLKDSSKSVVAYVLMKVLPKFVTKFLLRTGILYALFPQYQKLTETNVKDVLNELTDDETLKFVFGYAFGDYGTYPSKAPFLMHGMLMDYFRNGAYYPRGGSTSLAKNMIPGIRRGGGNVLVNANVERILTDDEGKVYGVSVKRHSNSVIVKAPIVVSSIGIFNTFQNLLPPRVSEQYDVQMSDLDTGLSCFQTFLGLKGETKELELRKRNYWIVNNLDAESAMKKYMTLTAEDAASAPIPLVFVSFPSAKDSCWRERYPGKSVCTAVTFVNWKWFENWENLSAASTKDHVYSAVKKGIQEQVVNVVLKNFPQLADKIEFVESGTPLSHKHYLGTPKGEIYGIDHTMKRFQPELATRLLPTTSIPGLYLTGQDIFTCGVSGAAVSGIITSGAIQGRNHFLDLYAAMLLKVCRRFWVRIAGKAQ